MSNLTISNSDKIMLNYQANPFHLVEPSCWPIFTAFSFLGLMFNFAMVSHGYLAFHWIILLNLINLIYVGMLWGRDVVAEGVFIGAHTKRVRHGFFLGYIWFLFTELAVFATFFWAYFYGALAPGIELGEMWPPIAISAIQPLDLPLLNTLILLSSGATVTYSHHSLIAKKYNSTLIGWLATIILGILFIVLQFIEYKYCTYTATDGFYGTTFFFLTGLHGFHLIGGVFFLSYTFVRLWNYEITTSSDMGVESTILLWHFLDVVWLFLYIILYYWGT